MDCPRCGATTWQTSAFTSGKASAAHDGFTSSLVLDNVLEIIDEGKHPTVGVVNQDDLPSSEQSLADSQRADDVGLSSLRASRR